MFAWLCASVTWQCSVMCRWWVDHFISLFIGCCILNTLDRFVDIWWAAGFGAHFPATIIHYIYTLMLIEHFTCNYETLHWTTYPIGIKSDKFHLLLGTNPWAQTTSWISSFSMIMLMKNPTFCSRWQGRWQDWYQPEIWHQQPSQCLCMPRLYHLEE